MHYNIGDKVIFIKTPGKKYSHKLIHNEIYEIYDISGTTEDYKKKWYGVLDKRGIVTTWFEYDDFITLKESRKQKIIKINKYNESIL